MRSKIIWTIIILYRLASQKDYRKLDNDLYHTDSW